MLGADPERPADGVHIPSYIQSADPSRARTGREQPRQNRTAAGERLQSGYLYKLGLRTSVAAAFLQ